MGNMEIFRDVVGYEGLYEVSDQGRVRSLARTAATWQGIRTVPERILKPILGRKGRLRVALSIGDNQRKYQVHRLVAAAFIGPCPDGQHCCHNDGNPTNNALSNLRYDTPKGNNADKLLHGTHNRGTRNSKNKITEAQVLAIRGDTRTLSAIAAEFNVTTSTIWEIRHHKSWAWLQSNQAHTPPNQ